MGITLNSGNRSRGNKDVTDMDTASVIHQVTIHKAVAITVSALLERISNGNNWIAMKNNGPKKRPNLFEIGFFTIG